MPGEEGAYAQAFHETHIRDKAQYLCAVIRACFPSCAGADRLPWETLVDPVPFPGIREAVMTFSPWQKGKIHKVFKNYQGVYGTI